MRGELEAISAAIEEASTLAAQMVRQG